ncbi:hypothetical protein XENOCAPTIV_024895 [Xenoophorus captivus]|uniref:Uncharacterized protein n=1 Tax=Xenoophorus captivus TaxID=1517983 RepID=A0ABV0QJX1_9TELE
MWNQTTNIATVFSYLPHSLRHQLPPDITTMIIVVRKVMNLFLNQLMSIINTIPQINLTSSAPFSQMNTRVIKRLAIPIISIRTEHLPYSCIVTLKWNVLSSGTESKQFSFFSKKTNYKHNLKNKTPAASPEWLQAALLPVWYRWTVVGSSCRNMFRNRKSNLLEVRLP